MNGILIDQEALKEVINDLIRTGEYDCNSVLKAIDNATPVDTSERETEAYKKGYVDGMIRSTELSNDVLEKLVRGGAE